MKKESVWDYPRPPKIEKVKLEIKVVLDSLVIAQTKSAFRVLETSHPPVYYIPQEHIEMQYLTLNQQSARCEFKGRAVYYNYNNGDKFRKSVAWTYQDPNERFMPIKDHLAFYPSKVDECWVGEETAKAQESDFYGGWITSNIKGPFKGPIGTQGW